MKAYGLGAAEGDVPPGEIDAVQPVEAAGPAQAQVVCEVGAPTDGRPGLADLPQPAQGRLQEAFRRHQPHRDAARHRREDAADQAHVMERGKPAERPRRAGQLEPLRHRAGVGGQVVVADLDAARAAGAAGGVLQDRRRVGAYPADGVPGAGAFDRQPGQAGRTRRVAAGRRQGHGDARVGDHPVEAVTVRGGRLDRVGRHDRPAGEEAAEDGDDIVEPARAEHQHRPAVPRAERRGLRAGPAGEPGVGQGVHHIVVVEELVGDGVRLTLGPPQQDLGQVGRLFDHHGSSVRAFVAYGWTIPPRDTGEFMTTYIGLYDRICLICRVPTLLFGRWQHG
jgi:hypothetical protein